MPSRCCVPLCKGNYPTGPKVSIFSFPKNKEHTNKWLHAIQRKDFKPNKNSRVCELHFKDSDIETFICPYDCQTGKIISAPLIRRLKTTAVPSIFPNYPPGNLSKVQFSRKGHENKRTEREMLFLEKGLKESFDTFEKYEASRKVKDKDLEDMDEMTPVKVFLNDNYNVKDKDLEDTSGLSEPTVSPVKVFLDDYYNNKRNEKLESPIIEYFPKPVYSYSFLIAMALKNSKYGSLPVSEIYNFICKHFPYFKTAPSGWKNSVRRYLSYSNCFEKIEKPVSGPGGAQIRGCLWAMNPLTIAKMDTHVANWPKRDIDAIKNAMKNPDDLEMLERGEMKVGHTYEESDVEIDVEEEEFLPVTTPTESEVETKYSNKWTDEGAEYEINDSDVHLKMEDDDDCNMQEDEPQLIGSDDELSQVPPSLQPFELRPKFLVRLNRVQNECFINNIDNKWNEKLESPIIEYFPKPPYSYSCLIAMALKNSKYGSLPVSEIYNFICKHFPYFKTASGVWKNSVRHNLSINKWFEKIEKPGSGPCGAQRRRGYLWALNPLTIAKMDEVVAKWTKRDIDAIKNAMKNPDDLEMLERGEMKVGHTYEESDGEIDVEEEEFLPVSAGVVPAESEVETEFSNKWTNEGAEYEINNSEVHLKMEDDDDCNLQEDEPQPIGSDGELSEVPPSLQPFEPRPKFLVRLNRVQNECFINNTDIVGMGIEHTLNKTEPNLFCINCNIGISPTINNIYDELHFYCNFCFKNEFDINNQIWQEKMGKFDENSFKCNCPDKFSKKDRLTMLMRMHDEIYPLSCDYCPKQCNIEGNHNIHFRFHTRVFYFECDVCKLENFPKILPEAVKEIIIL